MLANLPLAREDFTSTTWKRLEQELGERLAELRVLNDAPANEVQTATNRGRIAELKRILDLAQSASSKQGANPNNILDSMPG